MIGLIDNALGLATKYLDGKEAKNKLAFDTLQAMLNSETYLVIDALVKLAYASEQITKGLIRPLFSGFLFLYALMNPDVLERLHALGAVGDLGIGAMFTAGPGWMYSRHKEKQKKINNNRVTDEDFE